MLGSIASAYAVRKLIGESFRSHLLMQTLHGKNWIIFTITQYDWYMAKICLTM